MADSAGRSVWLTVEGVLLIILGAGALLMPLMAGVAASLVFAWVLILTGIAGLVSAVAGREHVHPGWSLVSALLALLVGVVLLINPLIGAASLALLIGVYLLLDGVALIVLALGQRRKARAWGWLMASGVFDLILAAFIVLMGAIGSAVMIGVIVGLSLIAAGIALVAPRRALFGDRATPSLDAGPAKAP
jgi:uncharacterized membrane protein HdeD (DUF308 family)